MVLYRKYRPQKFAAVSGQEHVKKTLINALISGNFSHSYLFAGPRGSGKTTLARILAKSLNCTGRKITKNSYEPCNKCRSCSEINAGKSLDVIEIDAASNRGIDEIRELRNKISFAPNISQYKVYIIDEVHMLTKEAFNALLKTLEEPPKHAIFIFATTEPHKVLPTILSRVQRFDFHKATLAEISFLLGKVAKAESLKIDTEVIALLAQLSFGAYRDALTLLDQISSVAKKNKIKLEEAQEILGLAEQKSVFEFIESLSEKNRHELLKQISKAYFEGVDLANFVVSLIDILRKILLFKLGQNQTFDLTKEQQSKVGELAESFFEDDLIELISKFVIAGNQLKTAHLPQLPLEMLVMEWTEDTNSESVGRKGTLSETPVEVAPRIDAARRESIREQPSRSARMAESEGYPETGKKFRSGKPFSKSLWPEVISAAKSHNNNLAAMLTHAAISDVEGDNLTLGFKFKFHADTIAKKMNLQIVEDIIEKIAGDRYIVSCVVDPELVLDTPKDDETQLLEGVTEVFEVEE